MNSKNNRWLRPSLLIVALIPGLSGCILAAAGVGAEAGYVAMQEERTAKETLADQLLVTSVKARLVADSEVPGFDINVDSFKGTITLRGALKSETQVSRALELARGVDGVKGVQSKLVVVE